MLDARPKSMLTPQAGVVKGRLDVDSKLVVELENGLFELVDDSVIGSWVELGSDVSVVGFVGGNVVDGIGVLSVVGIAAPVVVDSGDSVVDPWVVELGSGISVVGFVNDEVGGNVVDGTGVLSVVGIGTIVVVDAPKHPIKSMLIFWASSLGVIRITPAYW